MPKKQGLSDKKEAIRGMRTVGRKNSDGTISTHKMAWVGDPLKKRGNFGVFPTIAPIKKNSTSENPKDWKNQTATEATNRGEMINVNKRRQAEKLAAGSWKQGQDKKEAMKGYRNNKKALKKK